MEPVDQQSWFLRKYEGGGIFGPLAFDQVRRWAEAAQIAPHDSLSQDQQNWVKAPMFPELSMDWLVEVTSERYYGPTTLGAIREFLRLGEISDENFLINCCNGLRQRIRELPLLALLEADGERELDDGPAAVSMSVNWRDRVNDLEQSLREERRALQQCEERYRELEGRYQALVRLERDQFSQPGDL